MNQPTRTPLAAQIAIGALGLLSLAGGWFIVLNRGFSSALGKRSREFVEVTGVPAAMMAVFQFTVAALVLAWFFQRKLSLAAAVTLGLVAVFLPAALVHFLR